MGRSKQAHATSPQPGQDSWQVFVVAHDAEQGTQSRLVVLQPPTANVRALRGAAAADKLQLAVKVPSIGSAKRKGFNSKLMYVQRRYCRGDGNRTRGARRHAAGWPEMDRYPCRLFSGLYLSTYATVVV